MRIRTMLQVAVVLAVLAPLGGCKTEIDPVTGEKTVQVDPNTAGKVETGVEVVGGLAPLFGPVGSAVGGVILGVLAAWRKMKPQLTAAQSQERMYHSAASAVVLGIDSFKETNAKEWDALEAAIEKRLNDSPIPTVELKNIIRGLRGLPVRE